MVKLYKDDDLNNLIADVACQIEATYNSYSELNDAKWEEAKQIIAKDGVTVIPMFDDEELNLLIAKVATQINLHKSLVSKKIYRFV